MNFFGSEMTPPPDPAPFGNFPEIHPFWYRQASLILTGVMGIATSIWSISMLPPVKVAQNKLKHPIWILRSLSKRRTSSAKLLKESSLRCLNRLFYTHSCDKLLVPLFKLAVTLHNSSHPLKTALLWKSFWFQTFDGKYFPAGSAYHFTGAQSETPAHNPTC